MHNEMTSPVTVENFYIMSRSITNIVHNMNKQGTQLIIMRLIQC